MATTTTYTDARSAGGKITTRTRRRFNPYERPPPPQQRQLPRSPNWFTGVVVPASRKIASGAAKIISSVFDSDSESSYSSSGDSVYEDDAYSGDDHGISLHGVDELSPEAGTSSKEPQLGVGKTERKHVLEQLIMQETFSREESDRLVKIINSRVLEHPTIEKRGNVAPNDTPADTNGNDPLDLCNKAVTEARKWVKEMKVGSSPVSTFGIRAVSDGLQHIESKLASPVDMAKSYMNARPSWASPSAEHIELRTPSTMITQLTRDGNGESCSPLKRSSLVSGSWNIQDEIRRVRSKATENMLQTLSSSEVDLSSFALSPRTSREISADRVCTRPGDNIVFNSSIETKKMDGSTKLAAGASNELGFSGFFMFSSASENRQDGVVNEASELKHSNCVPECEQGSEAIQNGGDNATSKSHNLDSLDHTAKNHADKSLRSRNTSMKKEVKEYKETQNANDLPSSQASLSAGGISKEISGQPVEGKTNSASLDPGNSSHGIPLEDKCEFLSEASIEVPITYETASQNSYEELSQEQNLPEGTLELAEYPCGSPMKRQGKKPTKPIKRGRGRGK